MLGRIKNKILKTEKSKNIFQHIDNLYGHKRSYETKESVDQNGNPIPWMTFSVTLPHIIVPDYKLEF